MAPQHNVTEYADAEAGDEFTLPADLNEVPTEELEALETQAMDGFTALRESGDLSAESVESMKALHAAVKDIRAELTARAEVAATAEAELEALAAELEPEVTEEPVEEEAAEEVAEPTAEELEEVVAEAEAVTETAPEPVAASARKPINVNLRGVRAARARQDEPAEDKGPARPSIVASAEVPGVSAGSELNMDGLGRAMLQRLSTVRPGQSAKLPFGSFRREFPEEVTVKGESALAATEFAADERNLPGGSLVAAGGFCAVAPTIYEFCPSLTSMDGMIQLPEVFLPRGRANVYGGFEVQDYLTQGFSFTNADDIRGAYNADENNGATPPVRNANEPKPCVTIACPTNPTEVSLDGYGLCIDGGLSQLRAFPELTERFLEESLAAFGHKRNADRIGAMVAGSTAVTMGASNGATAHTLGSIELIVEHLRSRYRMAQGASMQGYAPSWLRGVVRSDLSKRLGVDLLSVTDERINALFAQRGLQLDWVSDWQIAGGVDPGTLGSKTTYPTQWPDNVDILIYPAGTWVEYVGEDVNLSIEVDQDYAKNNNRSVLFMEEFSTVSQRCNTSAVVTIPTCPNGAVGAGETLSCDTP